MTFKNSLTKEELHTMKKTATLFACIMLCAVISLCPGCSIQHGDLRLSNDVQLGEELSRYIDRDTKVVNLVEKSMPTELSMYRIHKRVITDEEYNCILKILGTSVSEPLSVRQWINRKDNRLHIQLDDIVSASRGYFEMSQEDLELNAREVISKLSVMEGSYEYIGRRASYKLYDNQGEHFIAVGAGFCPIIDGIRVVGNSNCLFYFDGTGLVELIIELYNYEKNDTMKLIPLQEAIERITDPDDFSVDNDGESNMIGIIDTLQVNRIELRYVNQFSQGKKFLIPVYCFFGIAIDKEGVQSKFTSIVNAFSS